MEMADGEVKHWYQCTRCSKFFLDEPLPLPKKNEIRIDICPLCKLEVADVKVFFDEETGTTIVAFIKREKDVN